MKKFIFIIYICSSILFADDFKKTGTAGFTFLGIPASARISALGEAAVSLSDLNSASVFTNPAGLGFSDKEHSLSISFSPWFAQINHYATSYTLKTAYGAFGISAIFLDYGTMERTVKLSGQRVYEQIGTYSANSLALGLSYSKQLTDKFSFGITAKFVNEKIDVYNASNVVMDGGFLYYTGLGSLRIGACVQNFGTDTKFKNSTFKMPAILRIGAAAEIFENETSRFTLIAEALHPTDAVERVNVGTEINLYDIISLRAGYKFFYDEEKYSLGIGIKAPNEIPLEASFSYSDYGVLGNILRFTLEVAL